MRCYSLVETAKIIKGVLKAAFPGIKFSVRSSSYSGGCSITAYWVDGPLTSQVDPLIRGFSGASFDGMIDLKSYHDSEWKGEACRFAPDYVFSHRQVSAKIVQYAAFWVHKNSNKLLALLPVKPNGSVEGGNYLVPFNLARVGENDEKMVLCHDNHRNEYLNQLVYQVANSMKLVDPVVKPEPPAPVVKPEPVYIEVPKGLIQ